jgi:hypothetical protein
MIKSTYASFSNEFHLIRFCIILTFFVAGMIINSCRKDIHTGSLQTENTTLSQDDISELKALYSRGIVSGGGLATAAAASQNFTNLVHGWTVNWSKYYAVTRTDNSRVAEFNLQDDSTLYVTRKTKAGDTVHYRNRTNAVFIKFTDGRQLTFLMKVIEDYTQTKHAVISALHYRQIPATFTGLVIYYTLNRKFIYGIRYDNGKLVARLGIPPATAQKQVTGLKINELQPPPTSSCGGETVIYGVTCTLDTYDEVTGDYVYDCEGVPVDVIPDDCEGGPTIGWCAWRYFRWWGRNNK